MVTSNAGSDHPRVAVFPPLFFLVVLIATLGLHWIAPIPWPWRDGPRWVGWPLLLGAVALAVWARIGFAGAGTNVNPRRPSTALVIQGPYRFTRNPMYLGMSIALVGLTFALHSIWGLVLLPVLVLVLHFGVVVREEAYLEAKFGDSYRVYKRRVRRWL